MGDGNLDGRSGAFMLVHVIKPGNTRKWLATCGVLTLVTACGDRGASPPPERPGSSETEVQAPASGTAGEPVAPEKIPPEHLVLAFAKGVSRPVDARVAVKQGLTIVDLGDDWVPSVIRGTAELPSQYQKVFADLANERGEPVDYAEPRTADYYLEVYGISPSFSTIARRLERERQQKCFTEVDRETLANFEGFLAYRGQPRAKLRAQSKRFQTLERRLKKAMARQGVERPADLQGETTLLALWQEKGEPLQIVKAAQERLACEKLFPGKGRYQVAAFDWVTHIALLNFERRHRVYGWGYLSSNMAKMLAWTPEEAAYHSLRRALAERVIDAAGIIEDGSTFRRGKAPTYVDAKGQKQGVRNLVEEFTEAAYTHLGLDSVDGAVEFLTSNDFSKLRVAVPLPSLPEYYSDHMDLSTVIDRGDVWYDYPYDEEGNEIRQPVSYRPTLTLFTKYRDKRIPLVRFGTTIGGWRSTVRDGVEHWAYKNSDVGARVWRRVVGAPSWIPPDSTPLRELVIKRRKTRFRRYEVDYAEMGPGYASAYGLVMGVHELQLGRGDNVAYGDNGIRSHGSVSYQSIQKRHSHGCHRLHNHLALRLFDFVLAHRNHKRVGQERVGYRREFTHEDEDFTVRINTRGYRFDLEPPVPVQVTKGRIRGRQKTPIEEYVIKPEEAERLRQADAGAGGIGGADGGVASPDGAPPVQLLPPPSFLSPTPAPSPSSRPSPSRIP
jgi:hypothetical protein